MKKLVFLITFLGFFAISFAQTNADHKDSDFQAGEQFRKKHESEKAFISYQKAADNGNAAAMNEIGWLFYNSRIEAAYSNPERKKEALKWFQKAADKGNGDAMYSIGWLHLQYDNTVPNSTDEAMKWFVKGAEHGSRRAMCWAGSTEYKTPLKVDWWRKAAELGDGLAASKLGYHYFVEGDYTESIKWFEMAYENDCDSGNSYLVNIYQNGLGVAKNEQRANEWKNKDRKYLDYNK